MWGTIKAGLILLGQLLGVIEKGQDAAHDANERQAGANAQKAASLEATVRVARYQTAAMANSAKDDATLVDDMRKGGF